MRLPDFVSTKQFLVGFTGGLLLFVAANVRSYWMNLCFYEHGWCGFGFPFECGYGFPFGSTARLLPFKSEVFWGGLVANFLAAIMVSILLGLLANKLFKTDKLL
jgi:hypothetical protein